MDRTESMQRFEQYLKRRFPDCRTAIDYVSNIRHARLTGSAATSPKPWREVTLRDLGAVSDSGRASFLIQDRHPLKTPGR